MSKGRKFLVVCAGFGLLAASLLANGTAPAGANASRVAAAVDTSNRETVRQLFYSVHEAPTPPIGWTGSVSPCNPGTVSAAYLEATRTRINYFRAMAGIQTDVTFDATRNANAQAAALLESANVRFPDPPGPGLNHNPPNTWTCYSAAGATGASTSNLAAGNTGPDAIDQLMFDDGALGHRRWTLDPQITQMGSGSVPNNPGGIPIEAQVVLPETLATRPPVRDNFIVWPPKGFVPYQVVYPRWSFALPNADFSAASVTMTKNGVTMPNVAVQTRDSSFAGPTITWNPDVTNINDNTPWPKPTADDVYTVNISNVGGVTPTSYSYQVKVFDPAVPDPTHTQPVITGPASAPSGQNTTYNFNAVPNATGYKWRSTQITPLTATDGAENGLINFDADVGSYNPVQSARKATGNNAFQLALCPTAGCDFSDQTLTRKNGILVNANSQLHFKSDLEDYQGTGLTASVEVSPDDGTTWTAVDQQVATGVDNLPFTDRTVALGTVSGGAFVGKTVKLRFSLAYNGGSVYIGDRFGWFFDDVAFTNTQEAGAPVVSTVPANTTSFQFNPASHNATYNLQVQPQFFGSGPGDWGPVKQVTSPK